MDIAGLSVSMSQTSLMGKVGIAVLDKTMEGGEDLAAGMLKMIDAAAMEPDGHQNLAANRKETLFRGLLLVSLYKNQKPFASEKT